MRTIRRLLLFLVVVAILLLVARALRGPSVPEGSMLVVELGGAYVEAPEPPLAARLLGRADASLLAVLSELRKASQDERLSAVLLAVRDLEVGWAKAQELRDAVAVLRESGRRPIALLETESFDANLEYYVASAAEEVYVAPGGHSPLIGLAAEFFFLGGLWEKVGAGVEVEQVGEYKSAAEMLAAEKMSEPHREMANALLDSVDEQFVRGIAESRDLEERAVRSAIAAAPTTPERLVELGLADGVRTRREILEARQDPPLVEAADYAGVDPTSVVGEPAATFALVVASGPVVTGKGTISRTGSPIVAADTVIESLEKAADDPEIDAILLRIDSPGGSPFASELIWQAARRLRDRKPLVASLSDVAASGGYYVASGADDVVADPATLTGSIGAFVARPVLEGLLERLGIGSEAIVRGPRAEILLASRPLSAETRAWLRDDVEAIYERFVERVAEGRELDRDRVALLARGRVWTGEQAAALGLVDALGGLRVASARAKEKLGIDADASVSLVVYPRPRPLAEQLGELLQGAAVRATLPLPAELERWAGWLAELPLGSPLLVPPVWVRIR